MANIINKNPIEIDTVGVVTVADPSVPLHVQGILVIASADTWSVILNDAAGNLKFRYSSAVTNHRSEYIPIRIPMNGITAATLTNITKVLVYTDSV